MRALCSLLLLVLLSPLADAAEKTVEQLAAAARPSVVRLLATGRDGKRQGVGTGFVVGEGLIATNLHVIGEGRPIALQTADGRTFEAVAVHATDRAADLAIVRIDAKGLPALELGDSDALKQGQAVVALGHPRALGYSVVAGVVSARREVERRNMIQVAIPIEQGNSGGPLLDMEGRVHGILTLKSAVTENLGFAMPINALKPMLAKPNPIPMARWLTLGTLDADEWQPLGGSRWRQRGGRIQVDGLGEGFGGRSLCLWKKAPPAVPFEVAVAVRLDDEAGAAGLVFHSDGKDRHYGFYPSASQMRLSRFEGPDVFSWHVLHQDKSPHYRPGEWNMIKVRVEKDRILCYCNDQLVVESKDDVLTGGQVGLAKFRDTRAEFKNFQVGAKVKSVAAPADLAERVAKAVKELPGDRPPRPELAEKLRSDGASGMAVLREEARKLEQRAARLRQLALEVHHRAVLAELTKALRDKDDKIDLLRMALLVARLDNEELEPEPYLREVDRMAREASRGLKPDASEEAKVAALNKYLFQERGFHGSRGDYYHKANSYLSEVIDDREGLPITLSLLYMEVAKRMGLKVVGVNLPGHFIVKHVPAKGEARLLDVYEGGEVMPREEADRRIRTAFGRPLRDADLEAAPKRTILVRLLSNLINLARNERDGEAMLRYLDAVLIINPDAAEQRWLRAQLRYHGDRHAGVLEDTEWLLDHHPEGIDLERVRELRRLTEREGR